MVGGGVELDGEDDVFVGQQVQRQPGAALFGDVVALEERAAGDEPSGVGDPAEQRDGAFDDDQPGLLGAG